MPKGIGSPGTGVRDDRELMIVNCVRDDVGAGTEPRTSEKAGITAFSPVLLIKCSAY